MALEKTDRTEISKFVRDTVLRLPQRDMKAVGIGRVLGSPEAATPPATDSSDRIATTSFAQTLVKGYVPVPSGVGNGDVPVWNGSAWVKSSTAGSRINNGGLALPKITTSALSVGPPASPSDGDIWIATGVDANGTRWQFQYNAGSSSAYKWEFIGGSPLSMAGTISGETISAWNAFGGASYTAARSGEYFVSGWWSAVGSNTSAGTFEIGVSIGGGAPTTIAEASVPSGGFAFNLANVPQIFGVGAGNGIALEFWLNVATTGNIGATLDIQPRRVS